MTLVMLRGEARRAVDLTAVGPTTYIHVAHVGPTTYIHVAHVYTLALGNV